MTDASPAPLTAKELDTLERHLHSMNTYLDPRQITQAFELAREGLRLREAAARYAELQTEALQLWTLPDVEYKKFNYESYGRICTQADAARKEVIRLALAAGRATVTGEGE